MQNEELFKENWGRQTGRQKKRKKVNGESQRFKLNLQVDKVIMVSVPRLKTVDELRVK